MATTAKRVKDGAEAEVQQPQAQPLPTVRAASGVSFANSASAVCASGAGASEGEIPGVDGAGAGSKPAFSRQLSAFSFFRAELKHSEKAR